MQWKMGLLIGSTLGIGIGGYLLTKSFGSALYQRLFCSIRVVDSRNVSELQRELEALANDARAGSLLYIDLLTRTTTNNLPQEPQSLFLATMSGRNVLVNFNDPHVLIPFALKLVLQDERCVKVGIQIEKTAFSIWKNLMGVDIGMEDEIPTQSRIVLRHIVDVDFLDIETQKPGVADRWVLSEVTKKTDSVVAHFAVHHAHISREVIDRIRKSQKEALEFAQVNSFAVIDRFDPEKYMRENYTFANVVEMNVAQEQELVFSEHFEDN